MNIIHTYGGMLLFIAFMITMIFGSFGLSVMEDCIINNDCDVTPKEKIIDHSTSSGDTLTLSQQHFDALKVVFFILPIVSIIFFMYFMLFTKYDDSVIRGIKKELKREKK